MLRNEWLLTCAPIGVFESTKASWLPIGAGVFIYDNPFIWYVTSHQQISSAHDHSFHILLRHKKMDHILFSISAMHKQENIGWIFDEENDIAATLFPANPDFELKAINFENFLVSQDMLHAMNCYSVSYPYLLAEQNTNKITPHVLEGIISRIDESSKVYVTTPIFPNNYGSPLFIWKSPFDSNNSIVLGNPSIYFGGIITKSILLDIAMGKNSISPSQSISLSKVSPPELIKNLLFSPAALSQKNKLKSKY